MDKSINFDYYYNNVPGKGLCRNNLIYTSLISQDKKTFVKWYYNDTEYHRGQNEVVDIGLMEEKWNREIKFLQKIVNHNKELVPKIKNIDNINKKIYFSIEGVDFWEAAGCDQKNFDNVLPDWQDQMLQHLIEYRKVGIWKYSLHPSSYFIVNGKLKSINYFFCYSDNENYVKISDVMSHISQTRQKELKKYLNDYKISLDKLTAFSDLGQLALDSFSDSYPEDFIDRAKKIYI
jgi:hypothetical protein